jgi:hypothetical protein
MLTRARILKRKLLPIKRGVNKPTGTSSLTSSNHNFLKNRRKRLIAANAPNLAPATATTASDPPLSLARLKSAGVNNHDRTALLKITNLDLR